MNPLAERLLRRLSIEGSDNCWLWEGPTWRGYGRMRVTDGSSRRMVRTHRLSYELFVGPILWAGTSATRATTRTRPVWAESTVRTDGAAIPITWRR